MLGANKEVFLKDYGVTLNGEGYTVFFNYSDDIGSDDLQVLESVLP